MSDDSRLGDSNEDGTATTPGKGDWGGIYFGYESGGSINHVVINNAGNANSAGAGFPIRVDPRTQPSINNVTLAANVHEAILVNTGIYGSSIGLNVVGIPYWIGADLGLDDYNGAFTIQPGVVLKMDGPGTDLRIVDGKFIANGTADSPIILTSVADDSRLGDSNEDGSATTPAKGDWGGMSPITRNRVNLNALAGPCPSERRVCPAAASEVDVGHLQG